MKHPFRIPLVMTAVVAAGLAAGPAYAAPPSSTSPPTIEGNADIPFVGDELRATQGRWNNNPTSYSYQWFRCNPSGDRQGCDPITGATSTTYTVQKADVGHKLHVHVVARNADGTGSRDSAQTGIMSDQVAPKNYVRPDVNGTANVGETLTVTPGTWAGATSIVYQWQQCDAAGRSCSDITGATGRSYGVRGADSGHTIRAQVTATNKYGSTSVESDRTNTVTTANAPPQTSTTVVTSTVAGNKAPSIRFMSLKVRSNRVYARFRVCDDTFGGKVTVIARDLKPRQLGYTRKFTVRPSSCGTYARTWKLIPRFRGDGRFVVTLRAQDTARRLSRVVSRSVAL